MYDMKPYLDLIDQVIEKGPYKDTWASLSSFEAPGWYKDAKFGIFIHWGVYSVPAFRNEWYSRTMYIQGTDEFNHHVATYGPHKDFGYKDFIPMFKAEGFDPDTWAELFKSAGAQYVVPVAEHHDGFQMYKSDISHWNAYEMGPKKDVLGELKLSCEKRGMRLGASTHRFEHWFFMGHGREFDSDIHEPMQRGDFYWPAMPEPDFQDLYSEPAPSEEYMQDWLVRTCEIIDRYQPRILYFDWWIHHNALKPYLRKLAAYYYNRAHEWGVQVAINYKHDSFVFACAVPDVERGQFADMKPYFWQTDTAIALNSWCYTTGNHFRPYEDIVRDLVDIVSKNGCLLLNVGPKPDGTFTEEDTNVLLGIGSWLKTNGEAIYGARPWRTFGEGPTQIVEGQFSDGIKKNFTHEDFRFTMGNCCLYAMCMKCAPDGKYRIKTLGEKDASRVANFHGIIKKVTLLSEGEVQWTRDEACLTIETDAKSDLPMVFRIEMD